MIFFVLILVMVFSVGRYHDLSFLALQKGSPFANAFTFSLLHTGGVHLLVNSFMLLSFWKVIKDRRDAIVLVFLSSFSSIFVAMDKPTMGASGIVSVLIGIVLAGLLHSNRKLFCRIGSVMLLTIGIQALFGGDVVNWKLHLISLFTGFVCWTLKIRLRRTGKGLPS